jgi:hypothetical protein
MKYLDNEATVLMVQTSNNRWEITTQKGFVLMGDIQLGTLLEAEDFVKRYLSSWPAWHYKLVPIEKKKGKK